MGELQKASLWKRVSAFLFDIIILVIVAIGLVTLMSAVLNYDGYIDLMAQHYEEYEQKYGIDLDISAEDFEALSEEQKDVYYAADKAIGEDEDVAYTYQMIFNLTLVMVSVSLLVATLALEFIVPLLFKNGQTLGKKIFGIAVMRTNWVKITPTVLFARSILGKLTIEMLVPVFLVLMILFGTLGFVGALVIGLIILLEIVMMCVTKTRSSIHDLISDTAVVDMATQRIFDTQEAMLEYKKKMEEEKALKAER